MRPRDLAGPATSWEYRAMEMRRVFRCLAYGLVVVLLATMMAACHGGAATDPAVLRWHSQASGALPMRHRK